MVYSSADANTVVNLLRDNIHLAGTRSGGVWYCPPTVLDEDGRLWGSYDDHVDRMLENRTDIRRYYRSLQPDAPVPAVLGRSGHMAAVEAFVVDVLAYYRPLLAVVDGLRDDLAAQTVVMLAEANALYNVVLAMRP